MSLPITLSSPKVQPANSWILATHASSASLEAASPSNSSRCSIYISAEPKLSFECRQVIDCFQKKNMSTQDSNLAAASHFLLFVTDTFLKSKEHVLPLIARLSDPHFKQRLFPVIMDKMVAIFSPGSELAYVQYWSEVLKSTNPNSSVYNEIKTIEENIASLIRAIRDTLMPPLNELLQKDLAQVTDTIEKRAHLLETKRFLFLPLLGKVYATKAHTKAYATIDELFAGKSVVTIAGEKGMGKTTLAIEYAKQSEKYPSGIFWLDAANAQTLEDSFGKLAVQLGTSTMDAKRELLQMRDFLLIYDNVADRSLISVIPSAHTLLIGTNLSQSDIVMTNFTDEDSECYVKDQMAASTDDARLLAGILENHPAKLSEAIAYIQSSKMPIQNYINFYQTDRESLLAKQQGHKPANAPVVARRNSLGSILDPSAATVEKYSRQSVGELSKELKNQDVQIFISYNWESKTEVEQIDNTFKGMGIELLRDARELRNFESIREFMKKVIRQADYTFSIVTNTYLKSFNCLFEVIMTLRDPHWRSRVFPIVLTGTNLDDAAILTCEKYWQQEADRLEKIGTAPAEAAIAQEGAKKIAAYLRFVKEMQTEPLISQLSTRFQKTMALMLARQEKLEKKGIYRKGIFHLSMGRNKDFTGRDKEMGLLEDSLKKGQYSAITNTGMGGVGKSQLALEYAYRHENEYEMIYWIRSEETSTLKSDYRMLGLEMGIAEDFLKDDKVISTVKRELEKRKGWLLVFDNAEDPKALAEVMPQSGGHILVTSRNPNWTHGVKVDVFSKDEALHYLQKISGVTGQEEELRSLAEELGHLPLALTQAGAYIKRQQIDVAAYRAAFKERQKQLLFNQERGYPGSVGTAWLMSIEKITQEDPNAIKLLNICGYLASDNIPEQVLSAWLNEKNKRECALDFHDAMRILESYSLINQKVVQEDGNHQKWISIHRLIQTVTRDQCSKEEATITIQLGVDVLDKYLEGDVGTKEEYEASDVLVQHAGALLGHAEKQELFSEKLGSLACEIGSFFRHADKLTSAKEMHEKAIKIKISALGTENHLSVANSYNNLGLVLEAQGDLKNAKEMHEKALKIKIDVLSTENHASVAQSYNNLGNVFQALNDLIRAKEMQEKGLKINIAVYGTENHLRVGDSYNNLGVVLMAQDDLEGAKEMYEKALKIKIAVLGTGNHLRVAHSYNNLGVVLKAQGKFKEAKEMYEKALKIEILVLGENHTSLATSYNNLGALIEAQGDFKEAKEMYEMELKITIAALQTENHTKVAIKYAKLGGLLYLQGDLKGAKEMHEKALKITLAAQSTENLLCVAESYEILGGYLLNQGDLTGSKQMAEEVLKIYLAEHGTENHLNVAKGYNNLAVVLCTQNDFKGAKKMLNKALEIEIGLRGTENHTKVANIYNNLGGVLKNLNDLKNAKIILEKALKINIHIHGTENHISVAESYNSLATILFEKNDLNSAKEMLEKALKIEIDLFGNENHITVAESYDNLGALIEYQGDLSSAKEMYEKALGIKILVFGNDNHPRVWESYATLTRLRKEQKTKNRTRKNCLIS